MRSGGAPWRAMERGANAIFLDGVYVTLDAKPSRARPKSKIEKNQNRKNKKIKIEKIETLKSKNPKSRKIERRKRFVRSRSKEHNRLAVEPNVGRFVVPLSYSSLSLFPQVTF